MALQRLACCRVFVDWGDCFMSEQERADTAVFLLHRDDPEVEAHNAGLSVLLLGVGNAALPSHVPVLASYSGHQDGKVAVAAVRALRRMPPAASTPTLLALLSKPGSFGELFSGHSSLHAARCNGGGWLVHC